MWKFAVLPCLIVALVACRNDSSSSSGSSSTYDPLASRYDSPAAAATQTSVRRYGPDYDAGVADGKAQAFAEANARADAAIRAAEQKAKNEVLAANARADQGIRAAQEKANRDILAARRRDHDEFVLHVAIPILVIALLLGAFVSIAGWSTVRAVIALYRDLRAVFARRRREWNRAIAGEPVTENYLAVKRRDVPYLILLILAAGLSVYNAHKDHSEMWIVVSMLAVGFAAAAVSVRTFPLAGRVAVFWFVSASFIVCANYADEGSWIRECAGLSVFLLPVYFLARALFNRLRTPAIPRKYGLPRATWSQTSFTTLAAFMTTVQIGWLTVTYIVDHQPHLLERSAIGEMVLDGYRFVSSFTVLPWTAAGLAAVALLIAAALRFGSDPFHGRDWETFVPSSRNILASALWVIFVPLFLLWNMATFITHYLVQVFYVARDYTRYYVVRFTHLIVVIALPFALLLAGHSLTRAAGRIAARHLEAPALTSSQRLGAAAAAVVLAAFAYALSLTFVALELRSSFHVRQALSDLYRAYRRSLRVLMTAGSVAYLLALAVAIMMIPVMTPFPAVTFGPFAAACLLSIGILFLIAVVFLLRRPPLPQSL